MADGDQSPAREAADPQPATPPLVELGDVEPTHRPGPPNRLALWAVVVPLIAMVVMTNSGNLFFSVLVKDHPAVFIGLNPSNRNLALASPLLDWWSYYSIGFLRLLAPDPLFFLLGIWYGDAAVRWMERKSPSYGGVVRQLEQWFHKARYPIVVIMPNNPVCLFAGAAGMSVPGFFAANVVGTIGRLYLFRWVGQSFNRELAHVRDFASDYRWPILALSFAIVGFTIWNDARKTGRGAVGDLVHLEQEIDDADHELHPTPTSEPET